MLDSWESFLGKTLNGPCFLPMKYEENPFFPSDIELNSGVLNIYLCKYMCVFVAYICCIFSCDNSDQFQSLGKRQVFESWFSWIRRLVQHNLPKQWAFGLSATAQWGNKQLVTFNNSETKQIFHHPHSDTEFSPKKWFSAMNVFYIQWGSIPWMSPVFQILCRL